MMHCRPKYSSNTYQKHEKYEEYIGQKEDRSQVTISLFYSMEIEVAQNCPQQGENGGVKLAEILDLKLMSFAYTRAVIKP